MYLSLARKYRPKKFADVAVQSHVSETLKGAIARGRVAHGYLLCGPRGVGKTTLARVLAMALNCERRGRDDSGEPCGECESCVRIWSGSTSLDVVEIDAASNRGVDDARELRERAMYAPTAEQRFKVYIVDEAHMLTREAWNALLKILEEPPPRVVFVFATTEPQKIAQSAAPVLSRLQRFDFRRIGPADVRKRLSEVLAEEKIDADPDALATLARAADGSMRDALSLTDQVLAGGEGRITAQRVREALGLIAEDELIAVLDLVADRKPAEIFTAIAKLADAGVDLGAVLAGLADLLRVQLALALGGDAPELSDQARDALRARAERQSSSDLLRMLQAIAELEPRFRRSGQQQILLEALLVRFAMMDRTIAIEEVLRELGDESGEDGVRKASASGGGSQGARATQSSSGSGSRRTEPPAPPRSRAESATMDTARSSGKDRLDLNRLVEHWADVVARVRRDRSSVLAAALDRALPVAVSARGDVTLQPEDDSFVPTLETGATDIAAAIGARFDGVSRVVIQSGANGDASVGSSRRLSAEAVKGERLALLRRRDPVLDAAVDALDLELLD
ncbi:MAG TPA: DNA polymerase III subunit gamma/tau [Gemmatimonadaceae bacterium]|nr:DNA polymerase III subunit gamma/tau [Gemmatimonadaceae bacterium]